MRRWKLYLGCLVLGASIAVASDYVTDTGVTDPDTRAAAKISARKLSDGTKAYQSLYSPKNAAAIVPNDSTDLANPAHQIYVGGAGDITVNMAGAGSAIVFKAVPVGALITAQINRVKATGTTATNLVELY